MLHKLVVGFPFLFGKQASKHKNIKASKQTSKQITEDHLQDLLQKLRPRDEIQPEHRDIPRDLDHFIMENLAPGTVYRGRVEVYSENRVSSVAREAPRSADILLTTEPGNPKTVNAL